MLGEELLEVENRELIRLRNTQKLTEGRIRVDRLLVHEAVGLGVVDDARGYVGAGDERTLREAKEGAELSADRRGLREDTGLGGGTIDGLRLRLPLLTRLLDETSGQLLNDLEPSRRRGEGSLLGRQLLIEGVELRRKLRTNIILGHSGCIRGCGGSSRSRGGNCSSRRDGSDHLLGSLLGDLGGGGGGRNRGSDRGRGSDGLNGRLLGSDLGRLGGSGDGAHYVSSGGSIGGHRTRYAFCVGYAPGVSTLGARGQKLPRLPRKELISPVTNEH